MYRHVNVIIGKVNRLEVPRLQTFDTIDSIDTIWLSICASWSVGSITCVVYTL